MKRLDSKNYFELYEVVSNYGEFMVFSEAIGGTTIKFGCVGITRSFYGRDQQILVIFDKMTGEASVPLEDLIRDYPVGRIGWQLCTLRQTPCETPAFEEQLRIMGRTASPGQVSLWKRECAKFRKECRCEPNASALRRAAPRFVWGVGRKLQERLDREFREKLRNKGLI
jgi:hypothetical protein